MHHRYVGCEKVEVFEEFVIVSKQLLSNCYIKSKRTISHVTSSRMY